MNQDEAEIVTEMFLSHCCVRDGSVLRSEALRTCDEALLTSIRHPHETSAHKHEIRHHKTNLAERSALNALRVEAQILFQYHSMCWRYEHMFYLLCD